MSPSSPARWLVRPSSVCAASLAVLAACTPWEPDPIPAAAPTSPVVQAGFVSNGSFGFADQPVRARGVYGMAVESGAANTDSVGRFSITMLDLSPPYLFEAAGWVSVAAGLVPNVNITPFTSMQAAVLSGSDPSQFFENQGQAGINGNPVVRRMTPAAIRAAQNTVLEVMREDAGFTMPNDTIDFVLAPFKARPGDPMADNITSFLNYFGDPSPFYPLLANEGKKCKTERVLTVVAGLIRFFCPALKSNLPDEADAGVTVYGFTSLRSDSLQVRSRNGTVVAVKFTRHDEEAPYACSGLDCTGVTLGPVRADETRFITFDSTRVSRDGGGGYAALSGELIAPNAGPPRPPEIECAEGLVRLTMQFEDGSLRQGCATDAYGNYVYQGITASQLDAFDDDGNGFSLVVRTRGTEVLSVATQDPMTGAYFYCNGAECEGIATTAPDENGSFQVSINSMPLPSINQDGTPTGAGPAIVTGNGPIRSFTGFEPTPCFTDAHDTLVATIAGAPPLQLCIGFAGSSDMGYGYDWGNGDTSWTGYCQGGCSVSFLRSNEVVKDFFLSLSFGDNYLALDRSNPVGVSLSGPDGDGLYTMHFDNVPMLEQEAFGITGRRTGFLNGTITSVPMLSASVASARTAALEKQRRAAWEKARARVALKPGALRTKKPNGGRK